MIRNTAEMGIVTPQQLIEEPWLAYDIPPFYDEWEDHLKKLPANLSLVHQQGSRAFWETLVRETDSSKMRLYDNMFAEYGVQPEEDVFKEALAQAKALCTNNFRVHHARYDLASKTEKTWENAPFLFIAGHSFHKIPPNQLESDFIEVEGTWWHRRDYFEAQMLNSNP